MKRAVCICVTLLLVCIGFSPFFNLGKRMVDSLIVNGIRALATEDADFEGLQAEQESSTETLEATLYYRYGDTPYLGSASVLVDLRREETVATFLLESLIDGPDASHDRLTGLFPEGTRLISAVSDGTTVFVTLSSDFLGRPNGAGADWEENAVWQQEAALRRTLAFQSIVATLTEEGQAQRVQLYVADKEDEIGRLLQMFWFDPEETDNQLYLGSCGRDESVLLTEHNTMAVILSAWQQRDWNLLSLFLDRTNDNQLPQKTLADELEEGASILLSYTLSDGTVSQNGNRATIVVNADVLAGDETVSILRKSVCLTRDDGNWTIDRNTLMELLVQD